MTEWFSFLIWPVGLVAPSKNWRATGEEDGVNTDPITELSSVPGASHSALAVCIGRLMVGVVIPPHTVCLLSVMNQ